ncbi:MAG: hypothetical protein AAFV80_23195, partial [Bacteroidota bacterium]
MSNANAPIKMVFSGEDLSQALSLDTPSLKPTVYGDPERIIELNSFRSASNRIDLEVDPEELIGIELENGVEWFMTAQQIKASNLVQLNQNRSGGEEVTFLGYVEQPDETRGFKRILIKILKFFGKKILSKGIAAIESKLYKKQGVFSVDQRGKIGPSPKKNWDNNQKYLLLIHGTFSSIESCYEGLFETKQQTDFLQSVYENRL